MADNPSSLGYKIKEAISEAFGPLNTTQLAKDVEDNVMKVLESYRYVP